MPYRLQVTTEEGERRTMVLNRERVSLGRFQDNDLSFPLDLGLSRHHLVFELAGGKWWAEDLHSKNGTLVNDQVIDSRVPLEVGDRIRASKATLVVEWDDGDDLQKTVVFDTAQAAGDRPPTHTVTLPQIVGRDEATTGHGPTSSQWSDPVTALVRVGRELVSLRPMGQLFEEILKLSLEAVGATRGVLLALEDGELRVKALRGDQQFRISTTIRDRVMRERTSLLVSDVSRDTDIVRQHSIILQQVHSLMAVPLQTDESVLGLIYVDTTHTWRQFAPADLNLLTVMANVAAIRIEHERMAAVEREQKKLEQELEQAAEIQRQFLPGRAPAFPGFDLAGYNCPCRGVGGDYYDFAALPGGELLVVLGDVAGKGMPASLLMVNLQARVQFLIETPATPAEMVTSLNRALQKVCPGNRFITFFLAAIDPASGEVSFCNAGHNPPFLVRAGGDLEMLEGGGPVLGILPGLDYQGMKTVIEPGDALVVFSDGVTEANNPEGEEYGEERLAALLTENAGLGAGELVRTVCDDLREFVSSAPAADDVTIVVARRLPAGYGSAER